MALAAQQVRSGASMATRPVAASSRAFTSRPVRISSAAATGAQRCSLVCRAQAAATEAAPKKVHPSPLSQAPPSTYAIIEVGGHQMFVEPGKWYTCNRLTAEVGSVIKFGRVLAYKNEGQLTVGKPYLENINIEAEIIEELRGPKVIVYKMKPKKHYRRKQGHRQDLTKFMVTKISAQ